jgi:hypothetical protein
MKDKAQASTKESESWHSPGACDLPGNGSQKYIMVNALKVFLNVALQYVRIVLRIFAISVYRSMGAFALSTSIAVVNKRAIKYRFYHADFWRE